MKKASYQLRKLIVAAEKELFAAATVMTLAKFRVRVKETHVVSRWKLVAEKKRRNSFVTTNYYYCYNDNDDDVANRLTVAKSRKSVTQRAATE